MDSHLLMPIPYYHASIGSDDRNIRPPSIGTDYASTITRTERPTSHTQSQFDRAIGKPNIVSANVRGKVRDDLRLLVLSTK